MGDGIDWGDDTAALQITVLEAGTQGKCTKGPVPLETRKNALPRLAFSHALEYFAEGVNVGGQRVLKIKSRNS